MPDPAYDAFVSYRRSDGAAVARWIRREVEGFRAPAKLAKAAGRKLKVYLDTAYERATADFFENAIRPALLASRHLVVVATPDAVASRGAADWVEREVSEFLAGPNPGNVIAVRGAGAFDDPLPARLTERFPNIEILDLRGASLTWFLNPFAAPRLAAEKIKLVAPLLDVAADEMPILRQEEERRQELRLGVAAGATTGVLVAVSALAIYAIQNQWRAERALESSLFAIGRAVNATAGSLPREGDYGQVRSQILNQTCDVIDTLAAEGMGAPRIRERVTCLIERAHGHEAQNEFAIARPLLLSAVEQARKAWAPARDQDAFYALAEAQEAWAAFLQRRKALAEADAAFATALTDIDAMIAHDGRSASLWSTKGRTHRLFAALLNDKGDKKRMAKSCDDAVTAYERAQSFAPDKTDAALMNTSLGEALLESAAAHDAVGDRQGTRTALERLVKARDEAWREEKVELQIEAARAYLFLADALLALNEREKASAASVEGGKRVTRAQALGALTAAQANELAELTRFAARVAQTSSGANQ